MLRTMALVASLVTMSSVSAKDLGAFTDWNGQTFEVDGELVCSMWSQPQLDEGKYTRRGDIFVWITHRPAQRQKTELVSRWVIPSKPGIQLEVSIDGKTFELFTDDSRHGMD